MKRVFWIAMLATAVLAGGAIAQGQKGSAKAQPKEPQKQQQQMMKQVQSKDQMMRTERMQASMKQCDQFMTRIHETNQWMEKQKVGAGYREMGKHMEEAGRGIQLMLQKADQLCKDEQMQSKQDRLREMDRLHEHLQTMVKDMEQAHTLLRQMAGAPGTPGA